MAQTFVVPGSEIFSEGGGWATVEPGFIGNNSTRTGYMIRKFMDETLDAVQFIGEYDFKEFRYGEVLLILAEALYEKNGQITDSEWSHRPWQPAKPGEYASLDQCVCSYERTEYAGRDPA